MASGSFKQNYVQCPFYKHDDGRQRITCEGLVDRSSVSLSYQRMRDYTTQFTVFCCEHYTKCEIYNMIVAAKYDDE